MKKRVLAAILAISMMACSMLGGCGAKEEKNEAKTAEEAAAGTKAGSDTEGAPDFSGVTLSLYYGTQLYEDMMNNLTADFKEQTGADIVYRIADGSASLKTMWAAGEAPDIISINGYADLLSWKEHLYDLSDESWIEDCSPSALASVSIDDVVYAMPSVLGTSGILYNKTMFADAGIEKVPETLTELEEACKKLQEKGYQPFGDTYQLWGFNMHLLSILFAYEEDNAEVIEAGLADGSKTYADFTNIDNWFRLIDLSKEYGFGEDGVAYSINEQMADFASGKFAMVRQGTWIGETIAATSDIDFGMFAIPCTDNAADTKVMPTYADLLAVNKDSENLECALYFLDWLEANAQNYLVDQMGLMASFSGMDISGLNAAYQDAYKYLEEGKAFSRFGLENWPAGYIESQSPYIQAYVAGESDKETTIKDLTELYRSMSE
ncbi:MAG: extracellular solute-binding protein [Lachnospiraceae bacterium]|nr:extracellular solute-binding protein [Lachnospiraceae bacterium]